MRVPACYGFSSTTAARCSMAGVGEETWRSLSSSGAAWSYYRDNIEEEFTGKRVSGNAPAGKNPLEELFRKS